MLSDLLLTTMFGTKLSRREVILRFEWIMNFEPTWILEFCSGIAVMVWGFGALKTDDYTLSTTAYIMPSIALFFGPIRWALLFRVMYFPRVMAAFAGSLWWAWLFCASVGHWGPTPGMGPLLGVFMLDFLTMMRFSVPCARELISDYRDRRKHR